MNFVVEPIWWWPYVVLMSASMLASVLWTYRPRLKALPPGRARILLGLRLLAWGILTFSMFRPALELVLKDDRPGMLLVLADSSRSGQVQDAPQHKTRREHIVQILKEVEPQLKSFSSETEVVLADFDKEFRQVTSFEAKAEGTQTALGAVLESIQSFSRGKRVLAVILLSDGGYRVIPRSPTDVEPRAAARKLADDEIRVDTVPIGTTALTEASLDLIAEDLNVAPTVFVKNKVLVAGRIRALGAIGQEVVIRVLIEEPGSAKPGEPMKMKQAAPPIKFKPTVGSEIKPVEFTFVAQEAGEYKLTLEVVPLDGEQQTTNNQLTTYINVLRGGVSVAYFDTVRPEQKWIRRIDESPDIQLDFKEIRRIPGGSTTKVESDWFTPGKYDVFIIGDVPASGFGEMLPKLARVVEQGAGLMMIGGYHSFDSGGYGRKGSALEDLLPISLDDVAEKEGVDESRHIDQPLQMRPHARGLQHFIMRLDAPDDKNEAAWRSLAPLQGANRFNPDSLKPLAIVLGETPRINVGGRTESWPLLVSLEVGKTRSLAFAADTTYQWPQNGQLELHQRFWQQAILWLAKKDVQGDTSLWVKLETRRYRPGQSVEFTFGARDPQKRPIPDADFTTGPEGKDPGVQVIDPKGQIHQIVPQRVGENSAGKFIETVLPGEYRILVHGTHQRKSLGIPAETRFVVFDQDLELHNPAADPALLQELSRITGGTHVAPDQLGPHLERLKKDLLTQDYRQSKLISLWDNWPLLVIFVLVLTIEWTLRKRAGLV